MAHIKTVTVRAIIFRGLPKTGFYWTTKIFKTFTDDNGNKTYYIDGEEVSKEDGNNAYLQMIKSNKEYQTTQGCKDYIKRQWASFYRLKKTGRWNESDFTLHEKDTFKQEIEEHDTTYEDIIAGLEASIDRYTDYIDNYRQQLEAEAHNRRLEEQIRWYEKLIAERK